MVFNYESFFVDFSSAYSSFGLFTLGLSPLGLTVIAGTQTKKKHSNISLFEHAQVKFIRMKWALRAN